MALRSARLFAIVCVLMMMEIPALAQPDSPAALRQRIGELEDRITRLQADLDRVQGERDRLLDETTRLRREILARNSPGSPAENTRPGAPSPESAPPGIDGTALPISALSQDPLASPDALYIAMLLEYREAFAPAEAEGAVPEADEVKAWAHAIGSKLEGPTTWLVRIDQIVPAPEDDKKRPTGKAGLRRMRATVLDGVSTEPISRPVMIEIPRRIDGRFPGVLPVGDALFAEMRVKVGARPVIEPGRMSPGPFDYPPFIGPHAGFGYDLDIVGLKFLEPEEITAKKNRPKGPVDR